MGSDAMRGLVAQPAHHRAAQGWLWESDAPP